MLVVLWLIVYSFYSLLLPLILLHYSNQLHLTSHFIDETTYNMRRSFEHLNLAVNTVERLRSCHAVAWWMRVFRHANSCAQYLFSHRNGSTRHWSIKWTADGTAWWRRPFWTLMPRNHPRTILVINFSLALPPGALSPSPGNNEALCFDQDVSVAPLH